MNKYSTTSSRDAKVVCPYITKQWFNTHPTDGQNDEIISSFRQVITQIGPEVARSTLKNYVTAVNKLEKYLNETQPGQLTTPYNITPGQIKAHERWMLDSGMSPNYTALHMRNLRALINRINQRGNELFKDVRTQRCQTVKRAVSEDVIRQLRQIRLDHRPKDNLARNIFLFCFFGMGIPLIDAVFMKKSQLRNGVITYYRRKTRRMVSVVVEDELQAVINALNTDDSSPYLLPILKNDSTAACEKEYRRFYLRYMRALHRLSDDLGLESYLTSYTQRHTWASIAYKYNGDVNTISQSLGHANANITSIYIKEISNSQTKRVNNLVIKAVS